MNFSNFLIKDEANHIVTGEVYVPLALDTDDDALLKDQVKKACHNFLAKGRVLNIDTGHDLVPNGCVVVENFFYDTDVFGKSDSAPFKPNSWVASVQVLNAGIWGRIQKGELNGFSFWAQNYESITVDNVPVKQILKLEGSVEPAGYGEIAEHPHDLTLSFDDDGVVIPTFTSEYEDHRHTVSKTTATDMAKGHAHRMVY